MRAEKNEIRRDRLTETRLPSKWKLLIFAQNEEKAEFSGEAAEQFKSLRLLFRRSE